MAEVRSEMNTLKSETDKRFLKVEYDVDQRAYKKDVADLETQWMDKLQELMNNLVNLFADKEQTRKKFLSLEKNVRILHNLADQEPVRPGDGFAGQYLQRRRGSLHAQVRGSCQLRLLRKRNREPAGEPGRIPELETAALPRAFGANRASKCFESTC